MPPAILDNFLSLFTCVCKAWFIFCRFFSYKKHARAKFGRFSVAIYTPGQRLVSFFVAKHVPKPSLVHVLSIFFNKKHTFLPFSFFVVKHVPGPRLGSIFVAIYTPGHRLGSLFVVIYTLFENWVQFLSLFTPPDKGWVQFLS